MLNTTLKLSIAAFSALMLGVGLTIMLTPAAFAEQLALQPVGVEGLSTLRAGHGAFLTSIGLFMALGLWVRNTRWFLASAALIGLALVGRLAGLVVDGMPPGFASHVGQEVVMIAMLVAARLRLRSEDPAAGDMELTVSAEIDRPIDELWHLVAEDFTSIQRWSASVITSTDIAAPHDPTQDIGRARYCTFTDDPDGFGALETIHTYDAASYRLGFDVVPSNAPAAIPMQRNDVELTLHRLGPQRTEVRWRVTPTLRAHGFFLYPVVRIGMAKSFAGILAELKIFAEQPAPAMTPAHAAMA